jgi:MFS family permease
MRMAWRSASAPRLFYGWVILAACFLITMVASGTMMAFGVFITPLSEDMGWSHSAVSFTYALSAIVSGLAILVVGSLEHSHSVRLILLGGTLIHGLGVYMTSTATSVAAFCFWYGVVAALGRSTFFISTATLITRWFEQRRGLAMGLTMAGNGLGPFIFSPAMTWLILRWDWQTAFVVMSIVMVVCLTLSCLFLRNHPHEMGLEPYGASPMPVPGPLPGLRPAAPAHHADSVRSLWSSVLRLESFWTLALINFFCCVSHSIPLVHIVGFGQSAGLSAFASAWVLAIMSMTSVIGRIYWGVFADRHGSRLTLMLTLFLQGTLVLWLVNTQDPMLFFLYALVWGFGYGGVGTQYGVVAREVFGARLFSPGYSGQNCFAMVGMAVGGFLGGYLYDISHSYAISWLVSFTAGLVAVLLAMDLVAQGERARAAQSAAPVEPETIQPVKPASV